ncbi:MAG: PqqD family protein [Actinobacteria bacterium]|nr:PqqD family protein [Actinomycetota bacterium]
MSLEGRKNPPLGPATRLRRLEGIAWREIDGEAVLVNVRRDEVMHLNPVAAFLWSRLDGKRSLREVARAIAEEFEVDAETAEADAVSFAGELLERGAVEVVIPE